MPSTQHDTHVFSPPGTERTLNVRENGLWQPQLNGIACLRTEPASSAIACRTLRRLGRFSAPCARQATSAVTLRPRR